MSQSSLPQSSLAARLIPISSPRPFLSRGIVVPILDFLKESTSSSPHPLNARKRARKRIMQRCDQ